MTDIEPVIAGWLASTKERDDRSPGSDKVALYVRGLHPGGTAAAPRLSTAAMKRQRLPEVGLIRDLIAVSEECFA